MAAIIVERSSLALVLSERSLSLTLSLPLECSLDTVISYDSPTGAHTVPSASAIVSDHTPDAHRCQHVVRQFHSPSSVQTEPAAQGAVALAPTLLATSDSEERSRCECGEFWLSLMSNTSWRL